MTYKFVCVWCGEKKHSRCVGQNCQCRCQINAENEADEFRGMAIDEGDK